MTGPPLPSPRCLRRRRGRLRAAVLRTPQLQSGDEAVLEARRDGGDRGAGQHRLDVGRAGRGGHDAHALALDHRIDDAGGARQSLLQGAFLPPRRRDRVGAPGQLLAEAGGRTVAEQLAFVQQHHLAAALRLVEVGGAEHDAHRLFPHQAVDDRPQLAARHRVDADGRLVEQQQARRAHQRAGQAELLLHAAGQAAGQARGERTQAGHVHQLAVARRAGRFRHPLEIGIEVEVLLDREILVEAEALRHVADRALHCQRMGRRVHVQHADAAAVRQEQAGGQAHQRRLAGAVGADQAGDHAAMQLQAHVAQGLHHPRAGAEALADAAQLEDDAARVGGRRVRRHHDPRQRSGAPLAVGGRG